MGRPYSDMIRRGGMIRQGMDTRCRSTLQLPMLHTYDCNIVKRNRWTLGKKDEADRWCGGTRFPSLGRSVSGRRPLILSTSNRVR